MESRVQNFKDLRIWQLGMDIAKNVYLLTKDFPKEELFVMMSQMRRSAISLPCNIAEGFKRLHHKEFRQFLHIALGSAAELETQVLLAKEFGYLSDLELEPILEKITSLSKMINTLLKKL
jgi:four helix bundle protein